MPRKTCDQINYVHIAGKAAATAGLNLASGALSTLSTTTLQSMDFSKIGTGDFFNSDMFMSLGDWNSWKGVVAGAASSGVSILSSGLLDKVNMRNVNGFNSQQIRNMGAMNGLAGSLAGVAAEYAIAGQTTVNLLNLADIGEALGVEGLQTKDENGNPTGVYHRMGLLELRLGGDDGGKLALGTGGADMGIGAVTSALDGLGSHIMNGRIQGYVSKSGLDVGDSLRSQWGFGDGAAVNQLSSILNGSTVLAVGGTDGVAETRLDGQGRRAVSLSGYREGMSTEEQLALGLVLQHEAHRDGVAGEASQQGSETLAATTAHTQMALNMAADKLYTESIMSLVSGSRNLQNDLTAYAASRYYGDDSIFAGYVAGNYDASADYWLFKLDGSIEDTAEKAMYKEYVDENGVVRRKKIEGSEYTGSRIKALVEVIGIENVKSMLSSVPKSIQDIPEDVLQSSFGWDEKMISDFKSNPTFINIGDQLLQSDEVYKLVLGEMLMYENGGAWDSQIGIWNTGELKIPGLGSNDSLGVTVKDDGSYQFFTAGLIFSREENAFEIYKNGKTGDNDTTYEQRDNTRISAWKRDLFTGETWSVAFGNAATSIDRSSKTVAEVNGDIYTGNTLVSDYFKMRLIDSNNYHLSEYGVNQVGIFTDATTLSGNVLNKGGYDGVTEGRYLYHPFGSGAGSEGCFGPMSDYGVSGYNNPNVSGTGAWHFQQQLDLFKEWGIYNGYEFNIQVTGKVRP